jgi:hypothetical protein
MTSFPQTLTFTARDGRRRTSPVPSIPQSRDARGGPRQALPAVDPSNAFGCVDWFLYPDQAVGRSAAEVQITATPTM